LGLTVEVIGENFYFRDMPEPCDAKLEAMMKYTKMEAHLGRIEEAVNGSNGT